MADLRIAPALDPDMIRRLVPEFNRTLAGRGIRPWVHTTVASEPLVVETLCHGCGYPVGNCKCFGG